MNTGKMTEGALDGLTDKILVAKKALKPYMGDVVSINFNKARAEVVLEGADYQRLVGDMPQKHNRAGCRCTELGGVRFTAANG